MWGFPPPYSGGHRRAPLAELEMIQLEGVRELGQGETAEGRVPAGKGLSGPLGSEYRSLAVRGTLSP